jgi:hypothetical protein
LPLGHGIGTSVAGIAMHHDLGSGIQPPHIIGRWPVHFDHGIAKSHRTEPLAGLTHDFNVNRFITGAPQASTDAVLAESLDPQVAVSLSDCRLNLFFNNAGINPFAGNFPGNFIYR